MNAKRKRLHKILKKGTPNPIKYFIINNLINKNNKNNKNKYS